MNTREPNLRDVGLVMACSIDFIFERFQWRYDLLLSLLLVVAVDLRLSHTRANTESRQKLDTAFIQRERMPQVADTVVFGHERKILRDRADGRHGIPTTKSARLLVRILQVKNSPDPQKLDVNRPAESTLEGFAYLKAFNVRALVHVVRERNLLIIAHG